MSDKLVIGYGDAMRDERIEVRKVFSRDGWVAIEDQASGECVQFPEHVARELGRAIARFQRAARS
jgi:hypothetical protein